jgi:hypothetical protein
MEIGQKIAHLITLFGGGVFLSLGFYALFDRLETPLFKIFLSLFLLILGIGCTLTALNVFKYIP